MPDPEKAFIARLQDQLGDDVTIDVDIIGPRPLVVVDLLSGGRQVRHTGIDRVRVDLQCYGTSPNDSRALAARVREAVDTQYSDSGWRAGGQAVARCRTDPPYPVPDPPEVRFVVSTQADIRTRTE